MTGRTSISIPVSAPLGAEAKRAAVEQIYYLDPQIVAVEVHDDRVEVTAEAAEVGPAAREAIARLLERVAASFARVETTVLHECAGRPLASPASDPLAALVDLGQVVRVAPGAYAYTGAFRRTLEAIDRRVVGLAEACGAVEYDLPAVIDLDGMIRNGYLESFPQHVYTIGSIREGPEGVAAFAAAAATGERGAVADEVRKHAEPRAVLGPAVCYNGFAALEGTEVAEPIVLTARNRCHRYESRNAEGIRRLQAFSMREIVFVAPPDEVERRRRALLESVWGWVEEWGLTARIETASDPFFAGEADKRRAFQSAFQLKYELLAHLPYDDSWLAIGSFNIHMDKLTAAYSIRPRDGGKLFSGCVAFGLDRFALALTAQFGTAPDRWPFELR